MMILNTSNAGSSSSSLSSTFSHYSSGSSSFSSPLISPPSQAVDVAAFVPFLWEEKPGISKQNTQNKNWQKKGDSVSAKSETYVLIHVSGKQHDLSIPPTNELDLEVGPLPPPPSMQNFSHSGHSKPRKVPDFSRMRVLSHTFPRGRQPRKLSQSDDPFLLAMEACSKPDQPDSDSSDMSAKSVGQLPRNDRDSSSRPSRVSTSMGDRGSGKRVIYTNLKSFSVESENLATSRLMSDDVPAMNYNSALNIYGKRGDVKRHPHYSGASQVEKYYQAQEGKRTDSPNPADVKLRDLHERVPDRLAHAACTAPSIRSISVRNFNSAHSRERQSRSVELSCGHHRKLPPPIINRQAIPSWFGCRSINHFEGAIVPLKICRPAVIPEKSRSGRQEKLDTLAM